MKIACYECGHICLIDAEEATDSWTCDDCIDRLEDEERRLEDELCEAHEAGESTRWSSVN